MRCDESEAVLVPRGRAAGGIGGVREVVDDTERAGEGGRTCLNALRLKDAESGDSKGAEEFGLAFCKDGLEGVEFVLFDQLKNGRFWLRGGVESGLVGKERVERPLCGSLYAAKEGLGAGSSASETDTPPMLVLGS